MSDDLSVKVAAVWAKYNTDKAALLLKAQTDVHALYVRARAERTPPRRKPTPMQYWSDQAHKKRVDPRTLDLSNLPELPDNWEELYYG